MKISRLLAILTILMNKEKVTAADLANKFEVSVRTIVRDMKAINEAGIPLISYQGYEGGYGIVESYKFDKSIMTNHEIQIAISALKGIDSALNNHTVKNLLSKFENIDNNLDIPNLTIDLSSWGMPDFENKKLSEINTAIEKCFCIEFDYIDMNGNLTNRIIEPLLLGLKQSTWYLYGYCTKRNGFRLFKVTRIRNLQILHNTFEKKAFNTDDVFIDNRDYSAIELSLKFDYAALSRVYDYFDYDNVLIKDDGYVYVKVAYPEDEWVYSTLMSFGDQVEVLEPEHIQDIIISRAENILKKYK